MTVFQITTQRKQHNLHILISKPTDCFKTLHISLLRKKCTDRKLSNIRRVRLDSGLLCKRQDESQNDALLSLARDTPAHVQT